MTYGPPYIYFATEYLMVLFVYKSRSRVLDECTANVQQEYVDRRAPMIISKVQRDILMAHYKFD